MADLNQRNVVQRFCEEAGKLTPEQICEIRENRAEKLFSEKVNDTKLSIFTFAKKQRQFKKRVEAEQQSYTQVQTGLSNLLKEKQEKKKRNTARLAKAGLAVAVIATLVSLVVFLFIPKVVKPRLPNDDLYTPEIVQIYSGTYKSGKTSGDAIITITSCDSSGKITGYLEFIVDKDYGKYEITGKITKKNNNGDLKISVTPGEWVVHPGDYLPLEDMELEISDRYQSLECSKYSMKWITGKDNEHEIKSASDLRKLSNSDETYLLKNDIDLSGVRWAPIEGFTGTLLGNGFTIRNLKIESSSGNVGFFSKLEGNVHDVVFENADIKVVGQHRNVGILCGELTGIVTNVTVSGNVVASASAYVGGVIGRCSTMGSYAIASLKNEANIIGGEYVGGIIGVIVGQTDSESDNGNRYEISLNSFVNSASIKGTGNYVGGIVGCANTFVDEDHFAATLYVADMTNTGSVSGAAYVGGIFGYAQSVSEGSYIQDSSNSSSLTANYYIGAIAGKLELIKIKSCENEGTTINATGYLEENGEKLAYVGGYVGYGYLVDNCTNTVEINYTGEGKYVGGIIGYTDAGSFTMTSLKNEANITGADYVGGIIGGTNNEIDSQYNCSTSLNSFANSASIKGTGNYVGGIIGYINCVNERGSWLFNSLYVKDMTNTGAVSGTDYVGGIFGYVSTDYPSSYLTDVIATGTVTGHENYGNVFGKAQNMTQK